MKSMLKMAIIATLVLMALIAMPAAARWPTISSINVSDVVFVYETNLDVKTLETDAVHACTIKQCAPPTKLVKFASDNPDPTVAGGGSQLAEIPLNPDGTLSVNIIPPYLGIWFPYNLSAPGYHTNLNSTIQIQRADVTLGVVLNTSHTDSIDGKSVTRATLASFKMTSNYAGPYFKINQGAGTYSALADIEVTTPGGGKIKVFGSNAVDLRNIALNGTLAYTDSLSVGAQSAVGGVGNAISFSGIDAGTYSATAKWTTTMPWYNLEPNSNAVTFTVLSKPITITTNKESLVRGNAFVVTVTGESKKGYWLYIKDAGIAAAKYPFISVGQTGVNYTVDASAVAAGLTPASTIYWATVNLSSEIAGTSTPVARTLANVSTAADGTRAVQFETTSSTDDKKFTIKVIDPMDTSKYDTVDVSIAKGTVTATYEGTGTYYLGETIKLSGTNTDSSTVYLFVIGPNLATNGEKLDDATTDVVDLTASTFKQVDVNTDDTWSLKWDTSTLTTTLDAGTYTIYAAAAPQWKSNLSSTVYDSASIVMKKPFITAVASSNTVAKGDKLYIRGTAEGKPTNVYVWIFGKNYRSCQNSASVKSDASYEYKLDRGDTADLYAGQYFMVVQHPMMNGIADIVGTKSSSAADTQSGKTCTWFTNVSQTSKSTGSLIAVKISGLQAPDAATALIEALNSPDIDDTYFKLSAMIEEPWIRIDTVGDKYVGDTFTITGTTNLAEADEILMTVVSSSFRPSEKTQSSEFSGKSGTVIVAKGDTYNTFSFDVDASTFKQDEYLVKAECIQPSQTATTTFNIIEGKPTTTATPTVTATATPTATATATATPSPSPTAKPQPGFGAVIALIGLGAVAVLVLRRH